MPVSTALTSAGSSVLPLRLLTFPSPPIVHIHSLRLPLSRCHWFDAILIWANRSPAIPAVLDAPGPHALLILSPICAPVPFPVSPRQQPRTSFPRSNSLSSGILMIASCLQLSSPHCFTIGARQLLSVGYYDTLLRWNRLPPGFASLPRVNGRGRSFSTLSLI